VGWVGGGWRGGRGVAIKKDSKAVVPRSPAYSGSASASSGSASSAFSKLPMGYRPKVVSPLGVVP